MLKVGDFIVNANNGICRIEDIVHLDMSTTSKDKLYYLMIPLEEKSAKIYIPVDSKNHRIRKVIDAERAWELIDEIPQIEEMVFEDDRQREQKYKQAIQSCDPEILVSIIKSMYHRKQERDAQGKKNAAVDERFFKLAENNLYAELAFSLGKEKGEMHKFIVDRIDEKQSNESI